MDSAVNVAGFLRGGLGLGEAGRLYVAALRAAGVPVSTTTVEVPLPEFVDKAGKRAVPKTAEFTDLATDAETRFNLICVNAPELPQFWADVGEGFFRGRRSIGVWAWEVDRVPGDWALAFQLVDEIWVYSSYVEEILRGASHLPVVRVPLPVVPEPPPEVEVDLGLPDKFTFLFLFDFYSTMQRKNPVGLIEAFRRAFEPGEGPQLLLKSFNGDYKPERLARVRAAAKGHPDIHVVDRYVTAAQKSALMARADCYVSLHRAEGYGLTLAEAMGLGKPVIATGFSGNTDFMSPENSYLVDYELTEVGPEGENYPSDGHWAEPDVDHAAALMREVWENRDEAAARAERGRADIAERLSLERVGEIARARLEAAEEGGLLAPEITQRRRRVTAGWRPLQLALGKRRYDPYSEAAKEGGARNAAKRGVLQAMRPYTHHQEELNDAMVQGLRELVERLAEVDELLAPFEGDAGAEQQGRDLDRVLRGMRARPASSHPAVSFTDERGVRVLGFDVAEDPAPYTYEDVFRGDEGTIRARQEGYPGELAGAARVIDLGCGRGEFLDLLRERGIAATGVELSEEMVAHCREKGHEVERADAIEYLRGQPPHSIPAAFAAQVVEHLPAEALRELLEQLVSKLEPGGTAILETVNPHAPGAMKAFWTDPTHHHPLFPEVLLAFSRFAGFASGRVVFREGSGDFDEDVYESPDYAVVLRTPG